MTQDNEKKAKTRRIRAEGTAKTWDDDEVRRKRVTRHSCTVTHEGITTDHDSVFAGFKAYGLPDGNHIAFRIKAKNDGMAIFEHDGKSYVFRTFPKESGIALKPKSNERTVSSSVTPMLTTTDDAPRTLRSPDAIALRQRMLTEPHVAPLARYVDGLRAKHPAWEFQDFDPLDGGIDADMLFLLEKPGPMTSPTGKREGSGFISRNNNDATAEAVFDFMIQAGILRRRAVLWNVIPGWNATIKTTTEEVRRGVEELQNLLPLLPKVRTVVLVGAKAQQAQPFLYATALRIFTSAHPSPKVRAVNRHLWDKIPQQWAEAARA